jgi:hypothetical protein
MMNLDCPVTDQHFLLTEILFYGSGSGTNGSECRRVGIVLRSSRIRPDTHHKPSLLRDLFNHAQFADPYDGFAAQGEMHDEDS